VNILQQASLMPKPAKLSNPPSHHAHKIRGLDLDKARPTAAAWALITLYFLVPAMLIGALIDLLIQWASGDCFGVWCLVLH